MTPWLNRAPARVYSMVRPLDADASSIPIVDDNPPLPAAEDDPARAHRDRIRSALARFHNRPRPHDGTIGALPRQLSTSADRSFSRAQLPFPSDPNRDGATRAGGGTFARRGLVTEPGLGGASSFASMRAVGQVGTTYLVLEGPSGMVVIDQHAAHERVVFERLRDRAREGNPRCQPLLFPTQVALGPTEIGALEEHGEILAAFGLDVSPFSDESALIRGIPPELDGGKAERVVRDALAELSESGRPDALDELRDALCARMACHASVRAGQTLAPEEIRALLRDLDAIDLGAHCPHGRPVVRSVDYDEMAQWFDRHT
jgi:DNA mismatch repair protein MutL